MKNNRNLCSVLLILFSLMLFNCTEVLEPEYKSLSIPGYWEAEENLRSYKNGLPNPVFYDKYYLEFLENNCGYAYNENEEWTNDIKWSLQERPDQDRLLLSYALNSNGVSTDWHLNIHNSVHDYTIDSFTLYRFESDSIGEDLYTRHYTTFCKRVE